MQETLNSKKHGDTAFRAKDFATAIECYTQVSIHSLHFDLANFGFPIFFLDNLQAAKLGDPEMAIATVIKYLNLISCFKFMIFHLESTFISKAHLPR